MLSPGLPGGRARSPVCANCDVTKKSASAKEMANQLAVLAWLLACKDVKSKYTQNGGNSLDMIDLSDLEIGSYPGEI